MSTKLDNMLTAETLRAQAQAARTEAARIFDSVGVPDRAGARLNAVGLKQAHRRTDSSLSRHTAAVRRAETLEHKAELVEAREREAARMKFTDAADLKGATHVRDRCGWHQVVRVNRKTVTVKTAYSWDDPIQLNKILEAVRRDANGQMIRLAPSREDDDA